MAQNGNGDEKRAKLIGSIVAAVVGALVTGGAVGYQAKGGEAHAAGATAAAPCPPTADLNDWRQWRGGVDEKFVALRETVDKMDRKVDQLLREPTASSRQP